MTTPEAAQNFDTLLERVFRKETLSEKEITGVCSSAPPRGNEGAAAAPTSRGELLQEDARHRKRSKTRSFVRSGTFSRRVGTSKKS